MDEKRKESLVNFLCQNYLLLVSMSVSVFLVLGKIFRNKTRLTIPIYIFQLFAIFSFISQITNYILPPFSFRKIYIQLGILWKKTVQTSKSRYSLLHCLSRSSKKYANSWEGGELFVIFL